MSLLWSSTTDVPSLAPTGSTWPEVQRLLSLPAEDLGRSGYSETLREILQQPEMWRYTGEQMYRLESKLRDLIAGARAIVLTGSGSSEYAADCIRPLLQKRLDLTVQTAGSGTLLTHATSLLTADRPAVMVSFGRSGDSPESVGALSLVLETDPSIRHLVLTCNAKGCLATRYQHDDRVSVVVLHERTNDRSLAMTSSFTSMVLAAMSLGMLDGAGEYLALSKLLSESGLEVLEKSFSLLPALSREPFSRAFYLAGGSLFGAARESALKIMEMTAGRVMTACETYLGLRHGPMSAVHADTLVVCLLSSDPIARAYECDVIQELKTKKLGMKKLIIGSDIPPQLCAEGDLCIESPGFARAGDECASILYVLVGQVLAFYRCLNEGLRPDAPSDKGVISRVVQRFPLHGVESSSQ